MLIFRQNGIGRIEPGRFRQGQQKNSTLGAVGFERRRDNDVGIEHEAER